MFQKKHGEARTKIYKVWKSMKARCHNKNHCAYERYGGRGILVSDEWMNDYMKFKDDMGERPEGYTLERIDNSKGYFKENCKWATRKENQINRRSVKIINYNGKDLCIADLAKLHGLTPGTLNSRIKTLGWTLEEALHYRPNKKMVARNRNSKGQFA